jgi:hypothetical protein
MARDSQINFLNTEQFTLLLVLLFTVELDINTLPVQENISRELILKKKIWQAFYLYYHPSLYSSRAVSNGPTPPVFRPIESGATVPYSEAVSISCRYLHENIET